MGSDPPPCLCQRKKVEIGGNYRYNSIEKSLGMQQIYSTGETVIKRDKYPKSVKVQREVDFLANQESRRY